jgi:hypothetical protein
MFARREGIVVKWGNDSGLDSAGLFETLRVLVLDSMGWRAWRL